MGNINNITEDLVSDNCLLNLPMSFHLNECKDRNDKTKTKWLFQILVKYVLKAQ